MDISLINVIYPFPKLTIDKSQTDFQIFSTYHNSLNHEGIINIMGSLAEFKKDKHISTCLRETGNEHFEKCNYNAAFEYYYKSIGVAPLDSYEYGLALANRSATFFANKNYEDCLKDIANVLTVRYPEHKLGKLFLRETECYLNLNQNHKAIDSWAIAADYLERFKNIVGVPPQTEEVSRKIMSIIRKLEVSDVETFDVICPKPELKDGENSKFLNASNLVELKNNIENGRHVVAKIDIEPGDVLFVEEPYCAVRNNEQKVCCNYCSNCLTLCMANIPCTYCSVHFYCSQDCRQKAWDSVHKWECYAERKELLSCKIRLVLNILLKASYNNFKIDVYDESVFGNRNDNFPFVNKLLTNKEKLTNDELNIYAKSASILVLYLKHYTDFFERLHHIPENREKPLTSLYELVGGTLLKLCMVVSCNETEVVNSSICYKDTPIIDIKFIGFALYVSSALLNHSCNPNTLVTFDKTLKVIRARDKIPKNTQITIDYCKYRSDGIIECDAYLLDKYKFKCACVKCSSSSPLRNEEFPWLCKICKDKAFHVRSETHVQCINPNCKHIFNIRKYKRIEMKIAPNLLDASINVNYAAFDNIYKQFKKIYHKNNVKFIGFYLSAYEFYLGRRIFEKCLEVCKAFVKFCDQFNEVNDVKVLAHLRMMVALTKYYNVMHSDQVPYRANMLEEINFTLTETKRLLSFYVPPNVVQKYEQHIQNSLNE